MSAACSNAPLVAFASKRTPRHVQRCGDRCDDDRAPNGTVKSAPELTPEQIRAADRIDEFLGAERDFPLVVHGLAGTGKTTLLADVALRLTAVLVAPTGKAASVLRKKTGMSVSTIHGLLYVPHEIRDVDGFVVGVTWSKKRPELLRESLHRRTVLVDEGSMVTDNIKDDLLNTGAQVVVFGDPGQLPPNGGRNTFFAQPHVRLREIHRQAEGSPIIRQAYAVRIGGYYCTDGTAFSATHEATDDDLDWADVVLCWKNATR